MEGTFLFSQFCSYYTDDTSCLEEIVKMRYPHGIYCSICKKITKHYKITNRTAYACTSCRNHAYPLTGTIFEKSSTPLRLWFLAMFLMTQTRGNFTGKQLQRELGVTYKTAWRMHKLIRELMEQNNGDLLRKDDADGRVRKWTFFNKFEFTVSEKTGQPS